MTHHLTSGTGGQDAKPTQIDLRVLTGASAILCAAHRSIDGTMHGHTWEITCWWQNCPDATEKQAELVKYLSIFDHAVLADGVAWAEKLGEAIIHGLKCVRVEIRRPLERIYAIIEIKEQA